MFILFLLLFFFCFSLLWKLFLFLKKRSTRQSFFKIVKLRWNYKLDLASFGQCGGMSRICQEGSSRRRRPAFTSSPDHPCHWRGKETYKAPTTKTTTTRQTQKKNTQKKISIESKPNVMSQRCWWRVRSGWSFDQKCFSSISSYLVYICIYIHAIETWLYFKRLTRFLRRQFPSFRCFVCFLVCQW